MTLIMLFHIRSKYTAVGRKEIVLFFYIYMFVELLAIFLDSTVIPTHHVVYPWFAAVYAGAVGALYWCILVNGFVGFQLYEDGTPMSLWVSVPDGPTPACRSADPSSRCVSAASVSAASASSLPLALSRSGARSTTRTRSASSSPTSFTP
jgi:hypothetical protein